MAETGKHVISQREEKLLNGAHMSHYSDVVDKEEKINNFVAHESMHNCNIEINGEKDKRVSPLTKQLVFESPSKVIA